MNKSEIDELREALMEAHIGDSSESLEELKYYNTPTVSPDNTRTEAFAPISMGSQRPITGNKRSRSTSGLSLAELQKQLGHHSDSSDDEMKGYNLEKKKKRRTVKLRGKRGGKRKRNRKKRTRRRGKKGGHAGNTSSLGEGQYTYTELAAMRTADSQRVYYLYIVNTNSDPPLEQAIGNGFIHRFKYDNSGNKIAITGHPVNNSNSTAYTIPNPAYHTMAVPSAEDVLNNFYNPAQGARREFRDSLTSMMENLQMGGRRKKRTRRRRKHKGGVLKDIPLNDIREGERYTVTSRNGNIYRGTLSRIVPAAAPAPGVPEGPNQLIFENTDGTGRLNIPENLVVRIQQYDIGPNEDTAGIINKFVGGRRKKRTRRRKSRRRMRGKRKGKTRRKRRR